MFNALLLAAAGALASGDTLVVPFPEVIVSATRAPQQAVEIPNATAIVTGEELRRRGVHTFAEALQDILGLDTGEGSDNGSRLPNIGLWGLKEFDALLITYDGVPVGGPFNPSLAMIPVEDLDRIEIVKGPQGTLYGVSAFAGMVQAFSRSSENGKGHVTGGGGSFSSARGTFGWGSRLGRGLDLRLNAAYLRSDGWQDRTESEVDRGALSLSRNWGKGRVTFDFSALKDRQEWGTPMPIDAGVPLLVEDRNYAVADAVVEHQVLNATSRLSHPFSATHHLENTLAVTHDNQKSIRSFPGEILGGDTLVSEGVALEPKETTVYEDVRLLSRFQAGGDHQSVIGAALTWGRTTAEGIGFDFDQSLSDEGSTPSSSQIPVGDHRSFSDRRTFFGIYAHDAWTPHWRTTISAGARYDATSEKLHAQAQEVGDPNLETADDSRSDGAGSGDVSLLFRTVREGNSGLQAFNLYGSWKSSFKPAAPNLTEAEGAEILDPERTRSWEAGAKVRAMNQLAFNASFFDMTFENMVVSILNPSLEPELVNAGEQRFKGEEADVSWLPSFAHGVSLGLGYAHHDARFVHFTFVTPDGELRNVSGNMLELVPRHLFNVRLGFASVGGPGAFVAARYQGERPLNRRNTFFTDAYTEWDAGVSYDHSRWMVSIVGRNLGDDRHLTTESEIGDSQFYVAPPRRFAVEATFRF